MSSPERSCLKDQTEPTNMPAGAMAIKLKTTVATWRVNPDKHWTHKVVKMPALFIYCNLDLQTEKMNTLPESEDVQKPEKKDGKKQITLERLRIALEKLQLARAKVCITFIVLGFTFYKFFYARIEAGKRPLMEFPNGRHVGILLIGVGLVSLLLGTIQHLKSLTRLKVSYKEMVYSVSLMLSYFILVLALFLLLVVIFEL